MSFDLYFTHRTPSTSPLAPQLAAWADATTSFEWRPSERGGDLWYESQVTGVYFSFALRAPDPEDPQSSGLSMNINYARPDFFAHEAMPLVVALADALGLDVVDPQGLGGPQRPDAQALIQSWLRGNQSAIEAIRGMSPGALAYTMAPADALAWWRYTRAHHRLKREFDDGFVPKLMLAAPHAGGVVRRVAVLTEPTIYVIPPADMFVIIKDGASYHIEAERFIDVMSNYITRHEAYEDVRLIGEVDLYDGAAEAWQDFWDKLDGGEPLETSRGVAPDGFVCG